MSSRKCLFSSFVPIRVGHGPLKKWILKSLHQNLSKEGSNFILNPLEVCPWVAKTYQFFDKLRILASYNSPRIRNNSEFATF